MTIDGTNNPVTENPATDESLPQQRPRQRLAVLMSCVVLAAVVSLGWTAADHFSPGAAESKHGCGAVTGTGPK